MVPCQGYSTQSVGYNLLALTVAIAPRSVTSVGNTSDPGFLRTWDYEAAAAKLQNQLDACFMPPCRIGYLPDCHGEWVWWRHFPCLVDTCWKQLKLNGTFLADKKKARRRPREPNRLGWRAPHRFLGQLRTMRVCHPTHGYWRMSAQELIDRAEFIRTGHPRTGSGRRQTILCRCNGRATRILQSETTQRRVRLTKGIYQENGRQLSYVTVQLRCWRSLPNWKWQNQQTAELPSLRSQRNHITSMCSRDLPTAGFCGSTLAVSIRQLGSPTSR